jgi:diadenylate cyclase
LPVSVWSGMGSFGWSGLIQVLVLWIAYYYVFLFFRGTRGAQMLIGLALLLAVLTGLAQVVNLDVLSWILRNISIYLAVALVVIFQPEIRRALAELGKHPSFGMTADVRSAIELVVEAVTTLAREKTGALIAIERTIGTRPIQETGTLMDARITPELLSSIFFPRNLLHDGGVIINGDRIMAAGCVFPLSEDTELSKNLGTRHRAALGLSEESDAAVIVVSEETGAISTCYRGTLTHGVSPEELKKFLSGTLLKENAVETVWRRFRKRLDFTPRGIAKSEKFQEQERSRVE